MELALALALARTGGEGQGDEKRASACLPACLPPPLQRAGREQQSAGRGVW